MISDDEIIVEPIATRDVHWMAFMMSELTKWDIDVSRLWIDLDTDQYSIPVAKRFLHKVLDAAERGLR